MIWFQYKSNGDNIVLPELLFVKQKSQPGEEHRPKKLLGQVRDGTCLLAVRSRLVQSPLAGFLTGLPAIPYLHVVPQHQLLRLRMQIHLLVHPVGYRIAVQVVLEPV